MTRERNRQFAMAEDFPAERDRHPLDDDWWASKRPRLDGIDARRASVPVGPITGSPRAAHSKA